MGYHLLLSGQGNMTENDRICCPHFEVWAYLDTVEHKRVGCQIKGPIGKGEKTMKCISFGNWINCETFKGQKEIK